MSERRLTVWMSSATLLRSLMRTLTGTQQFPHLRDGFFVQIFVEICFRRIEVPGIAIAVRLMPILRLGIVKAERHVVALAGGC